MNTCKVYFLLSCAALLLIAASVSAQAQAQTTNTIYACAKKSDGNLRLVNQPSDCKNDENAVSWNIVGPVGAQGVPGVQGAQGPAGPVGPPGPTANLETKLLLAISSVSVERTLDLGTIDVSHFKHLRVSAIDEVGRTDDPESISVNLSFVENGQDNPGLDPLQVNAAPLTKVYDAPLGRTLHVTATCGNIRCIGRFSLSIYGQ